MTFTLTGTAVNGTDYTIVPLMATFLAGQANVEVAVTPKVDATVEGAESVILTLTSVGAVRPRCGVRNDHDYGYQHAARERDGVRLDRRGDR